MSYPQPSSTHAVLEGDDSFRLITVAAASDIYEAEVSSLGFVLGPNSDYATVLITYLDPNLPQRIGQAIISPDRDFMGRVDARLDASYPGPSGTVSRAGRILISINDIYDTRWRPTGYGANDRIEFEQPILDVIQYFTANPSLTPQRTDRTFRYQYLTTPVGAPQTSWMVIPAFQRKSGCFQFENLDAANDVTVTVLGVKCSTSASPGPAATYQEQLYNHGIAASGGTGRYNFKSSTDGLWDMFAIGLTNYQGAAMPMFVTLSDDEA